jgi:cytosine/adenosine deaminase-related metal-dependent hydrolase
MTRDFPGMLFHTHAAESRRETDAVRKRCGMDNVEFFDSIGVLHANTCLAHCIWVSEREEHLMADRGAKVLHCPSSNLKLGSGIARIPDLLKRRISVSLGADGAPCNNTLDMFHEMRLAALLQKPVFGPAAMNAEAVFAMATLGGAHALGIENVTGSIGAGKKADFALLDLDRVWTPATDGTPYAALVYSASPENVRSVMIDGSWVYRDGLMRSIDEIDAVSAAREELRLLQDRVV